MALQISNEVIHTLATEQIMQNTKNFAQGTAGAIVPTTNYHQGDFIEEVFFRNIGGLNRRDPNSTADAVADTLNTAENVAVKLYFNKVIEYKLTDIKRYGANPDAVSAKIGRNIGDAITAFMLNKGLLAAVAAIQANSGAVKDLSGQTLDYKALLEGLKPFGDMFTELKSWVMNSAGFFGLMENGLNANSTEAVSGVLYDATPATLNRKVYVTDSPSLDAGSDNNGSYIWTLGLTPGAIVVQESEQRELVTDIVTGKENIIARVQLEGAITVKVKGFAYKQTAGANPDDATLGAAANWEMSASDTKGTAGTIIKTKLA